MRDRLFGSRISDTHLPHARLRTPLNVLLGLDGDDDDDDVPTSEIVQVFFLFFLDFISSEPREHVWSRCLSTIVDDDDSAHEAGARRIVANSVSNSLFVNLPGYGYRILRRNRGFVARGRIEALWE